MKIKFKGGVLIALLGMFGFTYLMIAAINYIGFSVIDRVQQDGLVKIPTNTTLQEQSAILIDHNFIKDSSDYQSYAKMMRIDSVYAGNYKLKKGMSYKDMMNILNKGVQTPVNVSFNASGSFKTIAQRVARQIEADSTSLVTAMQNDSIQKLYGMDSLSILTLLIPNTYEFYWNTPADKFLERMHKEYTDFWSKNSRTERLDSIGLTKHQVVTLASIVYGETKYVPEMPTVAGVYMNRLRIGMPLQADPTVIYALEDNTIRRVMRKHLTVDSPYNTYRHRGLPPGQINIPSIAAIDAVLNYEKCSYIYFCASEKLDGTHTFASNLATHSQNARRYSKKLNEMGIK